MKKPMSEKAAEYLRRMKEQRKAEHKCTNCGNQDERTLKGLTRCQVCADRYRQYYLKRRKEHPEVFSEANEVSKEWRRTLIANHVCVICRGQDAYTLNGRPMCAECTAKENERKNQWRQKNLQAGRETAKLIRSRWIAEHKCSRCGRSLPNDCRFKMCAYCRNECRIRADERRWRENPDRNKRGMPGICWQCNKRHVIEGKGLCEECYEMKLYHLSKARETIKKDDHVWKKWNKALRNQS